MFSDFATVVEFNTIIFNNTIFVGNINIIIGCGRKGSAVITYIMGSEYPMGHSDYV